MCTNQDQNHEKCLNTIKTCEPDEDMCLSEISWGCEKNLISKIIDLDISISKIFLSLQLHHIGLKEESNNIMYRRDVRLEPHVKQ